MRVLSGPRSAVVAALCLLPALLGLAAPAAAATAWSKPHHLPGHQAQGSLAALSCVSGSLCRSVDWGGSTRTFDGTAWSDVQQVTHWYGGLQAVSCSGRESCVAVGGRRTVIRRAGGWSAVHVAPRPGLEWVSCVSATLCLAATDRAYVLRWDGHHWSHGTRVSRARDGIRQVSCTSRTFCMAMDSVDHAFRFDGHGWTREHAFAGQTRLERFGLLSCYGTRRCLAVAFGHKQQDAVAVRYGAHGWGVARRTHLGTEPAALSCVASTFCVLLDSSGRARRLGAAGWQHLASVSITHDPLYRLSCGARGSCVATGQAGNSWQLASGAWSPVAVPQVPTRDATPSDDCVSAGHCVVLDGHGSVWTLDAGTWTRADLPDPQPLRDFVAATAVSCVSADFCGAVLGSGDVTFLEHGTWATPASVPGAVGNDISCVSTTFCVLSGQDGLGLAVKGARVTLRGQLHEVALAQSTESGEPAGRRWLRPRVRRHVLD